jgi:hypothetical protein
LYISRDLVESEKLTVKRYFCVSFELDVDNGEKCTHEVPHAGKENLIHLDNDGFSIEGVKLICRK